MTNGTILDGAALNHSLSEYLLSTYKVSQTFIGTMQTAKSTTRLLFPLKLTFWVGPRKKYIMWDVSVHIE